MEYNDSNKKKKKKKIRVKLYDKEEEDKLEEMIINKKCNTTNNK